MSPDEFLVLIQLGAAGVLIGAGVFALAAALIGLLRFPDLFTRTHAFGLAAHFGAYFCLGGLAIAAWDGAITLRLFVFGIVLAGVGPSVAQAIVAGAYRSGAAPIVGRFDMRARRPQAGPQ